jgi:hypothetical protein
MTIVEAARLQPLPKNGEEWHQVQEAFVSMVLFADGNDVDSPTLPVFI